MKKFSVLFLLVMGVFVLSFNTSQAYSLDDIKKDYPKVKIKKETFKNDAGKNTTYRSIKLMQFGTSNPGLKLYFYLREKDFIHKWVVVHASWYDYEWAFWNRITIGDGVNSHDIYPEDQPSRGMNGRFVGENLYFNINDLKKWKLWNSARQIRIKGSKYYADFNMPKQDVYQANMKIIYRYLWE